MSDTGTASDARVGSHSSGINDNATESLTYEYVFRENRRLSAEWKQCHEQNARLVGDRMDLSERIRVLEVDNMILRGLVARIVEGPRANLKRDAMAWLSGTFPR